MLKARTVKGKVASEKPNAKPYLNTILPSGKLSVYTYAYLRNLRCFKLCYGVVMVIAVNSPNRGRACAFF